MSNMTKKINSALISVYSKDGLEPLARLLNDMGVKIFSTGGTQTYLEALDIPVIPVEDVTTYPSILDGRVKTLHPKVFGGILARREASHLSQLEEYTIPEIDLVIVDLYPFEDTVANTKDEATIIEKIAIGGISLIRAAAKNYRDVVCVPSRKQYPYLLDILQSKGCYTDIEERKWLARKAFKVSSHYDTAIYEYFNQEGEDTGFKKSIHATKVLRYGENPHQKGNFYGKLEDMFDIIGGKELSYNNLVDVDAAVNLMAEFTKAAPTFAILKHNNACGVATRSTILDAWKDALACDHVSAFGGILISNTKIDLATATEINELFYEVLIAPSFSEEALNLLTAKKKRILLRIKHFDLQERTFKSLLNGVIAQDADLQIEGIADFNNVTKVAPTSDQLKDLEFANICAKHLKSNTISIVKNQQLIGMGCGQTSRVDALKQALQKAKEFGFDVNGAVIGSDAFFPFSDCVEIAGKNGISAIVQPGGSIKDQDSIKAANDLNIAMVLTGVRHFRH